MSIVERRSQIRCSQARAFEVSQDYQLRRRWDPFSSRRKDYPGGAIAGKGAVFTVVAWHGAQMKIEYVSWLPPERAAIRAAPAPWFLNLFAGSWCFVPVGEVLVEARFRYQIQARPGWRWLEPVMRAYFSWESGRRLAALKRYLESRVG